MKETEYNKFIQDITNIILQSRYNAAKVVNREMLLLYFTIGQMLSLKIQEQKWGAKVIKTISSDIQKNFPGLKGFSTRNLKNMKKFYNTYSFLSSCSPNKKRIENTFFEIGQAVPALFQNLDTDAFVSHFLSIGFTHHILLIEKCKKIEKRWFYIQKIVQNQWSSRVLLHHIETQLFETQGNLQNNFGETLPIKLQQHALEIFKDEYILNYINIQDKEDELVIENGIVNNIKQFLISLGDQFCFIGNQYRLIVAQEEFFIDLLFFHRGLQSLIAIELKAGKFKPEYVGKLNFYLNALDDIVRLPHENPSIGIILCKEKNKTIVEYAFKDVTKAMGVATYRTSSKLPKNLKKHLPDPKILEKYLNH